ncbi:MAG: hypothetical protein MJ221_03870 [Bacilli bacterium]|nr:hypothetical protein [Bacilli bacterium]
MKKLTRAFLIVSQVLSIIGAVAFLIIGIIAIAYLANQDLLNSVYDSLRLSGYQNLQMGEITFTLLCYAIIFTIMGLASIVVCIVSILVKRQLRAGASKAEMRAKAVLLIVFGLLSFEIPVVPGVLLLAAKESSLK